MPAASARARPPQPWILAAAALWAMAVPYLARLDVDPRVEVIDHVVPGVAVLLAAVVARLAGWRPVTGPWLTAAAIATLGGFWITATHVPLLPEVLDGTSPALAGALHLTAGPLIVGAGLSMVLARRP